MDAELPIEDETEPSITETATPETPFEPLPQTSSITSGRIQKNTGSRSVDSRIRKAKVIRSLVAGLTVAEAADMAGVKRSTVHGWNSTDPEFREMLREAEDRVVEALISDGVEYSATQVKALRPLADARVKEALEGADRKLALAAAAIVYRQSPKMTESTVNIEGVLGNLKRRPNEGD